MRVETEEIVDHVQANGIKILSLLRSGTAVASFERSMSALGKPLSRYSLLNSSGHRQMTIPKRCHGIMYRNGTDLSVFYDVRN